jgi:hypothetical protein
VIDFAAGQARYLFIFMIMTNQSKKNAHGAKHSSPVGTPAHEARAQAQAARDAARFLKCSRKHLRRKKAVVSVQQYGIRRYRVAYDSLDGLCASVHELLQDHLLPYDDVSVTLAARDGGGVFEWNFYLAHQCYAKGRISDEELPLLMFEKGGAL